LSNSTFSSRSREFPALMVAICEPRGSSRLMKECRLASFRPVVAMRKRISFVISLFICEMKRGSGRDWAAYLNSWLLMRLSLILISFSRWRIRCLMRGSRGKTAPLCLAVSVCH
jgi:hypothetical protein